MGRTAQKPSGIRVFLALSLTLPKLRDLLFWGFGELSGIQVLEPHPPEKAWPGSACDDTDIFVVYLRRRTAAVPSTDPQSHPPMARRQTRGSTALLN
jgi:hypothetical protein